MSSIPSFKLNNGTEIPFFGIGCWMGKPGGGEEVREAVEHALKVGYRHIDTAFGYANEEEVGKAIRNSGIPREQIYVTTKLTNSHHDRVAEGFSQSLAKLGLDYVDLYLVHWPQAEDENGNILPAGSTPSIVDTWKEMEKLVETGKVKSIGVSNFGAKLIDELILHGKIVPAVNQIEQHPLLPQTSLVNYCKSKNIVVTAYSPLAKGHADLIQNPVIKELAEKKGATPAQVILGWFLKKDIVTIPKSTNKKRIEENIKFVVPTDEEVAKIDAIHKTPGLHRSFCDYHSKEGRVFGWTYDELGWEMKLGGFGI